MTASDFTADAVVWNLDKLLNDNSPQFDPRQSAQGRSRIPAVAGYRRSTTTRVEITTKTPDATLPYQIAWIMMSSPAQWEKVGKSWDAFARTPSGTGPWKLDSLRAARARRAGAERGLLGQGARAEARPAGAAAAARGQRARRGAALGPGRLDRGAAAGCGPIAEGGGLPDRHQRLSA